MSAIGWMTPVSLLTSCTATSAGSPARTFSSAASRYAVAIDRNHLPSRPIAAIHSLVFRRTDDTSPWHLRRAAAIMIASVAPEVRMTSCRQPSASAIVRRAASSAARALRPSAWGELGFAQQFRVRGADALRGLRAAREWLPHDRDRGARKLSKPLGFLLIAIEAAPI